MAHLPRDGDDVRTTADKVGAVCVPQIVERQPRLTGRIQARSVRRLGQTSLREVAIAEWRPLTRCERIVGLSRVAAPERLPTVLAKKRGKLRQEDDVAPGATRLQLDESRWIRPRATRELVANPNDPLVDVDAPPAEPEQLHRSQPGEDRRRQRGSVQVRSRSKQAPDFFTIENAWLILRPALRKLFWLKKTEVVLGQVAAPYGKS